MSAERRMVEHFLSSPTAGESLDGVRVSAAAYDALFTAIDGDDAFTNARRNAFVTLAINHALALLEIAQNTDRYFEIAGEAKTAAELQLELNRRLDDSTAIDALAYAIACLPPGSDHDRAIRTALKRVIGYVGAVEGRVRVLREFAKKASKQPYGGGCDHEDIAAEALEALNATGGVS